MSAARAAELKQALDPESDRPAETPFAPQQQPAEPQVPHLQATKEVAMIVPDDVKPDRRIEFVVDDIKYSAVLPEGLKAGDTFRARIPVVAPPSMETSLGKRPPTDSTKKMKAPKKKREVKSEDEDNGEDDEDDNEHEQSQIAPEERISARVRERRSSAAPKEDPATNAWNEHFNPAQGIRYWYNTVTGMTSWDKPRGFQQTPPGATSTTSAPLPSAPSAATTDAPLSESNGSGGDDVLSMLGN